MGRMADRIGTVEGVKYAKWLCEHGFLVLW